MAKPTPAQAKALLKSIYTGEPIQLEVGASASRMRANLLRNGWIKDGRPTDAAYEALGITRASVSEQVRHLNGPMLVRLRECAADTSPNWDGKINIDPPEARGLVSLIDAALREAGNDHRDCQHRHGSYDECPVTPTYEVPEDECEHGRWNPDNRQCLDCGHISPEDLRSTCVMAASENKEIVRKLRRAAEGNLPEWAQMSITMAEIRDLLLLVDTITDLRKHEEVRARIIRELRDAQQWVVARDGGRWCERCEGEVTRGQAYETLSGTGGLVVHVRCPGGVVANAPHPPEVPSA